jgi:hypothetical protein
MFFQARIDKYSLSSNDDSQAKYCFNGVDKHTLNPQEKNVLIPRKIYS